MEAALISHWTTPARGREQQALQVFMDFTAFWQGKHEEGKCEPREVYIGLDGKGMTIVRGDSETLQEITESEEFRELNTRVLLNVDGYDLGLWSAGDEINRVIETYAKAVAAI